LYPGRWQVQIPCSAATTLDQTAPCLTSSFVAAHTSAYERHGDEPLAPARQCSGAPSAATGAQPQSLVDESGVTGYVLAPDGTPASSGTVVGQSGFFSTTASIDSNGRFRVVPTRSGSYLFLVSVPGLAPYCVAVTVPNSRSLRLPVIRLAAGAYYRVRLVSPAGEPIIAPQLRRRLFDASGKQIVDGLGDRNSDPADSDGAVTIGPLPRGIAMTVAVDTPLFAQTRLPDVNFGDAAKMDAGTIAVQQPGAVLHVDLLDGSGGPARRRS